MQAIEGQQQQQQQQTSSGIDVEDDKIGDRFQRIEKQLDWLLQQRRALSAGNAQLLSTINSCDSLIAQIRSHCVPAAAAAVTPTETNSPFRGAATNGNRNGNGLVELADAEDDTDLDDDVGEPVRNSRSKQWQPLTQAQRRRPPPPPPPISLSTSASTTASSMSSLSSKPTASGTRRTQSGGDVGCGNGQRWRQVPVRFISEEDDRRHAVVEVRLLPHRSVQNFPTRGSTLSNSSSSRIVRQAGVKITSSAASVHGASETGGGGSPLRKSDIQQR